MTEVTDGPALIPARMLNEYVYCPRLFYLEWVDARWAGNDDTAAGTFAHRAVDRSPGSALPSNGDAEFRRLSSVRLESHSLGVLAVIDRVESDDGQVVAVDVKKGRPRDDGTAWPADRLQVLVQSALLTAHGYAVDHAVLYYAETHQRVIVPVDDAALTEALDVVRRARKVADAGEAPLPLVDSPKCPRCSLVGLCLPDEVNLLLARSRQPPRRLTPRDPDCRPVYVTEQGASVGIKTGRLVVSRGAERLADIRLIDVAQLNLYGNVQVSSQALAELWGRHIPVLWFSYGGWLRGWAQGEPSKYVELRRRQVATYAEGALRIARQVVAGKIRNCRTLLRRNARADVSRPVASLLALAEQASSAATPAALLGLEGTAARLYFAHFPVMLRPDADRLVSGFVLDGRRRRPATDPVNALLSYVYSLLVKDLVAVCLGVGLDPFLGIYHRPRYGRPALALDLMEEFRPLIADSVVINLINNGEVDEADFVVRGSASWLTPAGRKKVLLAYERRLDHQVTHPVFRYKISYRRVQDVQARMMAAVMVGELPEYVPMVTR